MLIRNVCKECTLTKKAIEYYEQQGLVSPAILENGYRDFSQTDIEKLKKIALLRKLDLSIDNIRNFLSNLDSDLLVKIAHEKELELDNAKLKQCMLERLSQGISWDVISKEFQIIDQKQTITERLLNTFPGYYGRFISLHFSGFLNEPIETVEQNIAFEIIVDFLDNVDNFLIPFDLQNFLEKKTKHIGTNGIRDISSSIVNAVQDIEKYMEDNKEILKQYIIYKSTEEYKNSPARKIQSLL